MPLKYSFLGKEKTMAHISFQTPNTSPAIGKPTPGAKTDENQRAIVIGPLKQSDAGADHGGLTSA